MGWNIPNININRGWDTHNININEGWEVNTPTLTFYIYKKNHKNKQIELCGLTWGL
jgi:hypothetical protein